MHNKTQGVTNRAFAGPSDVAALVTCANASYAADQTGCFRRVEDVARDYAAFITCLPERNVWIADAGVAIAAHVRAWHWAQADGLQLYAQFAVVAPRWRRQSIGAALRAWLESRQREVAKAHGPVCGMPTKRSSLEATLQVRPCWRSPTTVLRAFSSPWSAPRSMTLPTFPCPMDCQCGRYDPNTTEPSGMPTRKRSKPTGATAHPTKPTTSAG